MAEQAEQGSGANVLAATAPEAVAESKEAQVALTEEELATKGRRVYLKCRACHSLDLDAPHKVGPNLYGFYGQPAASRKGYAYSSALSEAGIVWDDDNLSAYLEAPAQHVPGTKMAYAGLGKAEDRAAVIAYLKRETGWEEAE